MLTRHQHVTVWQHRPLNAVIVDEPFVVEPQIELAPAPFVHGTRRHLRADVDAARLGLLRKIHRAEDFLVVGKLLPGRSGEHQVSGLRTRQPQHQGLPFLNVVRRNRVSPRRVEVGFGAPLLIAGQGNGQLAITTEVDHFGFKAFARHNDLAVQHGGRGHPFKPAIQHVDLIGHLKGHVGHLAVTGRHVATADALTDLTHDRLAQIRGALVFDVGRLVGVGLVFTLLNQLALHQRTDKRRHTAKANIDVDGHELSFGVLDIREKLIKQKLLRTLERRHNLNQVSGAERERTGGSHGPLQARNAKSKPQKNPHLWALGVGRVWA